MKHIILAIIATLVIALNIEATTSFIDPMPTATYAATQKSKKLRMRKKSTARKKKATAQKKSKKKTTISKYYEMSY